MASSGFVRKASAMRPGSLQFAGADYVKFQTGTRNVISVRAEQAEYQEAINTDVGESARHGEKDNAAA